MHSIKHYKDLCQDDCLLVYIVQLKEPIRYIKPISVIKQVVSFKMYTVGLTNVVMYI